MLAQRHRFHGYGSLKTTYNRGFAIRAGVITARYFTQPGKPYRVAVVVSKKVSKSAVVRNRIRRRLYEAVRVRADQLPTGTNLIITAFDNKLATMPSEEIARAIDSIMQKIVANSGHGDSNHAIVKANKP